jgi:hypothetical protein
MSKLAKPTPLYSYSVFIPEPSEKVKVAFCQAADLSRSKNCLDRHGLSTAYGLKALAISFFNTFVYLAQGFYHCTKELAACRCSKAFAMLGKDAVNSAKSFTLSIAGIVLVALGILFPQAIYACFVSRQEAPKANLEILQKESKDLKTPSMQQDSNNSNKVKRFTPVIIPTVVSDPILEHNERLLQAETPASKLERKLSFPTLTKKSAEEVAIPTPEQRASPIPSVEIDALPKKTQNLASGFSKLPKEIVSQLFPFLSENSQKNLSFVCKDLYLLRKATLKVVRLGEEYPWNTFNTPEKFLAHYQPYNNVTELLFYSGSITTERMQLLTEAMKKGCFPKVKTITFYYTSFPKDSQGLELLSLIKSCPNLVQFNSISSPHLSIEVLKSLAANCPNLESLDLSGFGDLSVDDLTEALSALPNITKLKLPWDFTDEQLAVIARTCPVLKEINIPSSEHLTEKGVIHFIEHHPKLKKLSLGISQENTAFTPKAFLSICKDLKKLAYLNIDSYELADPQYRALSHLPPSLVSLKIPSTAKATDAGFENFPFLPELKHLHISHGQFGYKLTDPTFLQIAKRCPSLRYLALAGLHGTADDVDNEISEETLVQILSFYPNLEYLDLSRMRHLTDATLLAIAKHLPRLRFLQLWCSGKFTKAGLENLGRHCKSITHVSLGYVHFDRYVPTRPDLERIFPHLKYAAYTDRHSIFLPEADLLKAGFPSWK